MKNELLYGGITILVSAVLMFLVALIIPSELGALALFAFLLHNIGFAFGLGGDLVSDYFSWRLSKNKELYKIYLNTLQPKFKSLILVGFILMLVVHVGELLSEGPDLIHVLKVIVLIPIGIAGFYMLYTIPKLRQYIAQDTDRFAKLFKRFNVVDFTSLGFWIADLVLNTIHVPTHGFEFLTRFF